MQLIRGFTAGINTLRLRQNGRHFADDIFKWIFLNENMWILIHISLKFVPKGQISNIPAMVQIMVWRRSGDKPLSEPMMVSLLMHIYASLSLNVLISRAPYHDMGKLTDISDCALCRKGDASSFFIWADMHTYYEFSGLGCYYCYSVVYAY